MRVTVAVDIMIHVLALDLLLAGRKKAAQDIVNASVGRGYLTEEEGKHIHFDLRAANKWMKEVKNGYPSRKR